MAYTAKELEYEAICELRGSAFVYDQLLKKLSYNSASLYKVRKLIDEQIKILSELIDQ